MNQTELLLINVSNSFATLVCPAGTDSMAKLVAECPSHAYLAGVVELLSQGGLMETTLQLLRELFGDKFASGLRFLAAGDQLSFMFVTVGHSLFTNFTVLLAVIYVIVATEFHQQHEVGNCIPLLFNIQMLVRIG